MSEKRFPLTFDFPKRDPPAEVAEPAVTPEKPRVYYPSPDIGSSLTRMIDNLFEDIDEYSYKTTDGNVAIDDRVEVMILVRGAFVGGLLRSLRPDVGDAMLAKLEWQSDQYDGDEFLRAALVTIGEAIGATMFGRQFPGVSVDDGGGLGDDSS